MQGFNSKIEVGKDCIASANLFLSNQIRNLSEMNKSTLSLHPESIKTCTVADCNKKQYGKSLCQKHYTRLIRRGTVEAYQSPNCGVLGCDGKYYGQGYCAKHYARLRKYGNPLEMSPKWGKGETFKERFWSRVKKQVNEKGCWEWQGTRHISGYGHIGFNGQVVGTHIVAWFFTFGTKPTKFLLHSCDNPPCCNPNHLREGTQKENVEDCIARNRRAKGEKHGRSKLTEKEVLKIIDLLLKKELSNPKIAKMFNVGVNTVRGIQIGKNWKYLTEQMQSAMSKDLNTVSIQPTPLVESD